VPEQLRHHFYSDASIEKVGREGAAERMRRHGGNIMSIQVARNLWPHQAPTGDTFHCHPQLSVRHVQAGACC